MIRVRYMVRILLPRLREMFLEGPVFFLVVTIGIGMAISSGARSYLGEAPAAAAGEPRPSATASAPASVSAENPTSPSLTATDEAPKVAQTSAAARDVRRPASTSPRAAPTPLPKKRPTRSRF